MNEIVNNLNRLQTMTFAIGVLGLTGCGIGGVIDPNCFFISWLFAFVFWIGLSLGCLNTAMIHYLTGGRWGHSTRRFLEAGFMTLPLMTFFFIPVLFGLNELYPWARTNEVAADKILQQKVLYENFTCFLVRAVFFFGLWLLIATRLRKWSLQQDFTTDTSPTVKMRTLSGPGIVIIPISVTFAIIDWIMSIEPAWYSTIFGVILLAGQVLIAIAFIILVLAWLRPRPSFDEIANEKQFHDLGNLLLAFVMFWTYVAFSQLLIIYSGNQPHEIGWYLRRIAGSWKFLAGAIAAFHFFVPFFLLLFRFVSSNIRRLAIVAILLFMAHVVEIFWTIAPTFYRGGITVHWTDFAAWFGIGGIWISVFAGNLKRHSLLPLNSRQIEQTVHQPADA